MEFPDGLGHMGYGPVSGAGYNGPDATASPGLFARAMVIDQGGWKTRVFLGFLDLQGGSRPVTLKVVQGLERLRCDEVTRESARPTPADRGRSALGTEGQSAKPAYG
ncbi:MAG: hypothetical protein U1F43_31390 [Myxococcota bacterium]